MTLWIKRNSSTIETWRYTKKRTVCFFVQRSDEINGEKLDKVFSFLVEWNKGSLIYLNFHSWLHNTLLYVLSSNSDQIMSGAFRKDDALVTLQKKVYIKLHNLIIQYPVEFLGKVLIAINTSNEFFMTKTDYLAYFFLSCPRRDILILK